MLGQHNFIFILKINVSSNILFQHSTDSPHAQPILRATDAANTVDGNIQCMLVFLQAEGNRFDQGAYFIFA